jgi:cytochrome c peroxidase
MTRMRFRQLAALIVAGGSSAIPAQLDVPPRARSYASRIPAGRAAMPIGKRVTIPTPLGLPPVPIPEDNPPTEETIALGHRLFFDKILSRDGTLSCASCHDPKFGMADARPVSLGVENRAGKRNAPSVINAAYNASQFWDGRALTLEEQAAGPVLNPLEFAHSIVGVERRLNADPAYIELFAKAWGPGQITFEMAAKSIASYERTLVSGNSPFDRYQYGGDKTAMNESAVRGLKLFLNKSLDSASCINCHRIDEREATFMEARFHNTGVAWDPVHGIFNDLGRAAITGGVALTGAFRTVTLRNIAITAPYMHDGSVKTLEDVVKFYFEGGRVNPFISGAMPHRGVPDIPKDQQEQAIKDIAEFMRALTGEMPALAREP